MRLLAVAVGGGAVAALVLGVAVGVWQGESVVQWIAYMLSIVGAVVIGFACFSGAPTSARAHVAKQLRQKPDEEEEQPAQDAAAALVAEASRKAHVADVAVLFGAGLLLVVAGTLVELAT